MFNLLKKWIYKLLRIKRENVYLSLTSQPFNYSEDIILMREFSEVITTIDKIADNIQGGKDKDGNRINTEMKPLSKEQLQIISARLKALRMDCLRDRAKTGFTAVQNAISYLGNLRKGQNQLHILLIVKALLETGISHRGGVVKEFGKDMWKTEDGRWLIKKVIIGKRAFFDIYLLTEEEIFTLRCTRKGDAEEVLKGSRPL